MARTLAAAGRAGLRVRSTVGSPPSSSRTARSTPVPFRPDREPPPLFVRSSNIPRVASAGQIVQSRRAERAGSTLAGTVPARPLGDLGVEAQYMSLLITSPPL